MPNEEYDLIVTGNVAKSSGMIVQKNVELSSDGPQRFGDCCAAGLSNMQKMDRHA